MRVVLGLGLIAAAAGCAVEDSSRPEGATARAEQCFRAASVNSFTPVGEEAVDVRVSADRQYRLTLGPGCFDVDWANRVALRSRSGGYICGAADAELIVPSFGARRADRCLVTDVRRLSQPEIDAARERRRN